jgi:hypothetical protein
MITGQQLFDWPSRHHVHLVLPLMLVISFGLHAVAVVVFQASHHRALASPERPAQVWFLPPGSPEAARVTPMLEASDPALFSPGQISARDLTMRSETAYVPSFDSETPALAPLPPPALALLPPVAPVITIVRSTSAARPSAAPQLGRPTALKAGGGLAGREILPPATAAYFAPPRLGLLPLVFLVSVSPDGRPLHMFPQNSSGDESLDREALQVLAASRFSRADSGTEPVWGSVTFLWGVDVQRDKQPHDG